MRNIITDYNRAIEARREARADDLEHHKQARRRFETSLLRRNAHRSAQYWREQDAYRLMTRDEFLDN